MLKQRNRLIIYGDVVQGTVAPGELLRVPLNGSFAMTIPIENVEMVDGTSSGSHVVLVVDDDDSLGHQLIQGLNFTGETLVVQPPE